MILVKSKIISLLYFNFAGKRVTAYFDLFWWIHLEEEEESVAPLTEDDGGQIPSNYPQDCGPIPSTTQDQFGRGQPLSSVSAGWKPKPIQWKLLGGGNTRKKTGPTTKAQESRKSSSFLRT